MSIDRIFLRYNLHRMNSMDSRDIPEFAAGMGLSKTGIRIDLDHHFHSKVYTSSSPVRGTVTITPRRDVKFDVVQIRLLGRSQTRLDGVDSTREVSHVFLKLAMPIPESTCPEDGVFLAGRSYRIPFEFVIPDYLTLNACSHHVRSPLVHDQHVLLPPTMGTNVWEKDDMAPRMAEVEYLVSARVLQVTDTHGNTTKMMEASRPIHVLPVSVEEPPLNLTKLDKLYTMTKTKTLRKSLLSGKLGRVTAEAIQPAAVVVRPDARSVSGTTALVHLTFNPSSLDTLPPKVTGVTGKIVAHTYYCGTAISDFPNHGNWARDPATERRGHYFTSASLPAIKLGETRWTQKLSPAARRDSGYSSESTSAREDSCELDPLNERIGDDMNRAGSRTRGRDRTPPLRHGEAGDSPILHTTKLRLPIRLPQNKKTFIPTFHSCITSRVYTLQLSISLSSGPASSTVNLSLPVQVVVQPDADRAMGLPSFEAAVEQAQVDEYLQPRLFQVPDQRYTETSVLPGYGER